MALPRRITLVIYLWSSLNCYLALQPFNEADLKLFKTIYKRDLKNMELQSYIYSALGLKSLENIKLNQENCGQLNNIINSEIYNIPDLYMISLAYSEIPECQINIPTGAQNFLERQSKENLSNMKLYQVHEALKYFKLKVDSSAIYNKMVVQEKTDHSVNNLAFLLKFVLDNPKYRETKYLETIIKDLFELGDEIDQKYVQFSGGVAITSLIIDTVNKLTKEMPIKNFLQNINQKFVAYLLDKKQQTNSKNAYYLYRALQTIETNSCCSPLIFNFIDDFGSTFDSKHPNLRVAITDLMGHSISKNKELSLTAKLYSAMNDTTDTPIKIIKSFKTFNTLSGIGFGEKNVWYETNIKDLNLPGGTTYTLVLDVKLDDLQDVSENLKKPQKHVGYIGHKTIINIGRHIDIKDAIMIITDDRGNANRYNLPNTYSKLKEIIKVFPNNKISVTFNIKDSITNENTYVQQSFFRFFSMANDINDVYYIAEAKSNNKIYEFDMILDKKRAKEFNYLSGDYSLEMLISDQYVSNSLQWQITDFKLNFPDSQEISKINDPSLAKMSDLRYQKKPIIKHTFKVPEKRPPQIVSLAFCGLVFLPLLLMIILWIKTGFNIKRFEFSLWALIFHGSLAATFVLYLMFWLKLNMFQTMRYMTMIGPIMFFSGNRLLRSLANNRNRKDL